MNVKMTEIETYIVDSFTDEPFKGNPAGVCLVEQELSDAKMLSIAKELGLSETAFIKKSQGDDFFSIRYFSPKMEIPLCGHATLAASKVLFQDNLISEINFVTIQNLDLKIQKDDVEIIMEFPVYNLEPDYEQLRISHNSINGVLVTSPSNRPNYDFESRYFWPWSGTNEDPVTGGTHTFLAKYWSDRLGKTKMNSFQCSERSGFMEVELINDRKLTIRSMAQIVFKGQLIV